MSSYSQQQWQSDYEGHPVRLLITCRREGYEPWTLLQEVATGAGPEEKKQASEIKVQSRTFDGGQAGVLPRDQSKPVHMLVVTNASARPIRNLAAEVNVLDGVSPGRKPADVVGRIDPAAQRGPAIPKTFTLAARSSRQALLNAGEDAAMHAISGQVRSNAMQNVGRVGRKADESIAKLNDAVSALQRGMRVIATGIDYAQYNRFEQLTQHVQRTRDGKATGNFGYAPDSGEYAFCTQFVITSALRIAELAAHSAQPSWLVAQGWAAPTL